MSVKAVGVTALVVSALVTVFGFATDAFFIAWLGWGLIFGTMEWYTLARKQPGDTLSEQVWLGTQSSSLWWKIFWRAGVFVLLSWLVAHFLFMV